MLTLTSPTPATAPNPSLSGWSEYQLGVQLVLGLKPTRFQGCSAVKVAA
jgi:hypothetical protein